MMRILLTFLVVAVAGAANAQAPMIGPTCMTGPAPTPADLAAWDMPVPLGAAKDEAGLDQAALTIDRRADLLLVPSADVRFVAPPTRPMGNGGMAGLTIAQSGTYRIALGSSVAIDLLRGGKRVMPTARAPGRYVLQVTGNAQTALPLLVVKR